MIGLFQSHRTTKGYMEPCDFYYKWYFDVEGAEFHMIEDDVELFPDVEFKLLKGHTPGTLAMILHLENRVVIFPSDTIPRSENYKDPENRIHPTTIDVEAFRESVRIVKTLQKKYNADIIFPHDDGFYTGYTARFEK